MNIETFGAKEARAVTKESAVRRAELFSVLCAIRDAAIEGDDHIAYNKPMDSAMHFELSQKGFGIVDGPNHSILNPSYIISW